ncbi:DUF2884 family protein [Psychrobium sp. 1_MG-2023]|uniref:DUF2884 family protein n=1 Tax=Psychrobium sp. 1_MG-2023 TaxID=3062624 RepID=UPI000C338250|nr:DUF2884 family protein [Psychrobium sp. 1_MG-2023]MDP2562362.1 DUF2884 family protein [Psychrobium sp. 1_MG-2023]PKF55872.1 hypothetical protein CW748_12120 [Alteromonadales bacterium alter-6D02]
MKTKLAIAAAAFLTTSTLSMSAFAHDVGYSSDRSCEVNLEQSVKVTPAYIQVLDGEKSLFRITEDAKLYSQGKLIHLDAEQQAIVNEYHDLVQELAPQVAELVAEGLALAQTTITEVFENLFEGETELQGKIESIVEKFEQRLAPMMNTADGEYYLSKEQMDVAGNDLGQEIESEVESLIRESSGHMLMLLGKLLTQGENGMQDFEQKMESFGERIEAQGKELELQAEQMCAKIERLEQVETKMQQKIPAIADFNLVSTQHI